MHSGEVWSRQEAAATSGPCAASGRAQALGNVASRVDTSRAVHDSSLRRAVVRIDAFETLPKEIQDQVAQAAAETEKSQFELLASRTAENYVRMRANGVRIAEPAPAAVIAALKRGAAAPIAAWKTKVPVKAAAIVDWAGRQ